MGRKIAKQIRGMNGWAKGALVLALTLLVSTFMYQGWFTPNITDSATNTYRFTADATAVNVGADGSTTAGAFTASNITPGGKYSLAIPTFTSTGYLAVPANATTTLCTMYGPVYGADTVLSAPAVRLAQRAGAAAGQTTAAAVYDYDPNGAAGNGTLLWTGTGAAYTSTSTGYTNLSFGTTTAKTIPHGHRIKIVVSATNSAATAGRFYFYSSNTNSSYFTVTESFPTSTTSISNLVDYNGGNITGVTPGQQNVAMLSFQVSTNATSSTVWSGGKLDKIGTNVNPDDVTFAIYRDTNNDGSFNPGVDTKISDEISFTQATGQGYTLVTPQTITTTAQRYFVVYNLSPAAASGTTIGAQILDESYFTVAANNMNPMTSGASSMLSVLAVSTAVQRTYQVDFNSGSTFTTPLPAAGVTATNTACTTTAATYSTNVYGLLNYPSHTCTAQATTNYNTLTTAGSMTLYFNGAGYGTALDNLQGVSFTFRGATGTSGTASTLKAALFYVTPDGTKVAFPSAYDGTVSLGTSTTLAAQTITFNATNYNVTSVPRGSRLGMTLTATGASARLGLNSAAGAKLVMSETASVNNGVDVGDGKVITDASVTAGTAGKVVDAFTMVASTGQTVTSLTVTGTNTNATNISSVKIYRDQPDGSGAYGTLGDEDGAPIGTGAFSGSSAVVTMNETVDTTMKRYLVVYDIASTAVVGQKITGLVTSVGGATADVIADTSSAGLTVVASTVVTEGAGEPATVSVAPGGSAVNLNAFGLYTNGPTDTINTVTVQLPAGTSGAVALMEIIDRSSATVYGSSTAPIASDTWRMTVSGLSATSATAQCYVRITPKAAIAGTYAVTGQVTAITHVQTSNVIYYNDATSATVVIDGIAPSDPTLSAVTGITPGLINLSWSAATDSNPLNTGISYKVVRGPANAPAPSDCNSGTTVYQGTGQSVIDDTGMKDGHVYTFGYRACAVDGVGNRGNGSIASAAAKLPSICNQAPTLSFTTSPNQYAKTGGSIDYSLNIINNDIGDCPPVAFTVSLDGTNNDATFQRPVLSPATPGTSDTATIVLGPNGGGADVNIHITAFDTAPQGEAETFIVRAAASGYAGQAKEPLVATVNNFGPMLHSSFSVGTKYGTWGVRSTCNDCHINTWESTRNIKLISENVLTPLGRRPVNFSRISSSTATLGIFGNEQRALQTSSTNVCEVCHHNTKFHQYSAVNQQTARDHHNGQDCMGCHPHRGGFKYAGGAIDCVSCHGNPPTAKVEMVSPPLNALGANPTDWGAHARHNDLKLACAVCHNNYTQNQMGNRAIEMGFNINGATYPGFGGSVTTGTVIVSSTYNTYYNWTSHSAGTTVIKSDNQSVPSCSIYCHGGWQGGGGTNTTPTWVGNYQAACGTCHNYTNANPPATGSHMKHAKDGNFLDNGVQVGGLNMSCVKCHGSFANYTGVISATHINGNVQWDLNGVAATATYRGSVAGSTGNVAPSASFGTCGNLYCHSNVQGADGTGAPTIYQTPTWGGAAHCGSCHVNMYTDAGATGGHKQHAQPSAQFATPFDCRICHGNGGTTNPKNHANGTINMEFSGYGANTVYSNGVNVAPGTLYGSCSTSDCHGRRTVTWGAASNLPLCDKCHGSRTSAGGFYATSGPGTAVPNTDPIVGAHNAHIHQVNSAFTLYTSYSAMKDCSECHIKPSGPYDAGHIDTALPAEVTFQPGSIANRAVYYGFSGARAATYSAGTCNNIWCHGAAMDSNVGRGPYATVVADGGTLGTPRTPTWNQPFLNGDPRNDCNACHGYPPSGPNELYTHFSHYSTIDATTVPPTQVVILKQPNECNNCHVNVKLDGSGFINSAAHINGSVDKGCNACHGVPPNTVAELAILSNGALAPGQAGAHKAHADLPAIGKICSTCHNGYTVTMPSLTMEMGFNALGGKVTTGAFWGYSTVNNGLTTFVSTSPGTVVYQTNTQTEQNTCAVYCHGLKADGSQIIGGRYGATAKPVWDSGASMVCGNCHGVNIRGSLAYAAYTGALQVRPDSAPTTSSHPRHAAPAGLNMTCDVCHGVITNFAHVNGSVAWSLDTANPRMGSGATYSGTSAGATGNLAPSASYGSCNNVYCHSSGQALDGGNGGPVYANQPWGAAALGCSSCHNDMATAGTGSHLAHTATAAYACTDCHGAGYLPGGVTAATHVDRQITVSMTAGSYTKGTSFNPGLGYSSCSVTTCHGQGNPTWGATLYSASVQCDKCHAGPAYSGSFYSTAIPKVTVSTDAHVGMHTSHLQATHGISAPVACASCHPAITGVKDSGHMNGTVEFNASKITTYASGSCTSTCHEGTSVSWTQQSYFNGIAAHDCALCHAYPPATNSHNGVTSPTQCITCHDHVNAAGDGFTNPSLHINGAINAKGSHDFPYPGATHMTATGATTPVSSCGCHNSTNPGSYPALSGAPNCMACHTNGLLRTVATSSCYDCHGSSDIDGRPVGNVFPNISGSHTAHVVNKGMICTACHASGGTGNTNHGSSNRIASTGIGFVHVSSATNAFRFSATGRGTCSNVACHGTAEWGVTKFDCVTCHSSTVVITAGPLANGTNARRAVAAELKASGSRNHKGTAVGSDATKWDCIVCHMEGDYDKGTPDKNYHGNGVIDFRDPDNGQPIRKVEWVNNATGGKYVDTLTNFTTARFSRDLSKTLENDPAWLKVASIQMNLCLKCHDADGAKNSTSWSKDATGAVVGTQLRPFGLAVGSTSTYPLGNGTSTTLAPIAAGGVAGNVMNVFSMFSSGNAAFHPVRHKQNNGNVSGVWVNAPWNAATTPAKVFRTNTVYGWLVSCFDCHAALKATGVQSGTVVAHGNGTTATTAALRGPSPYTAAAAGSPNLCTVCHADLYFSPASGYGHGSTSPSYYVTDNNMSSTRIAPCANCHAGGTNNAAIRAQDAHGVNALPNSGNNWPSGTRPYAFFRNTQSLSNWSVAGTCASGTNCSNSGMVYTPGGVY